MRLLAKGKGQVVGLNRVVKLSHREVRFEQKLEGEQVSQRYTREKSAVGRRSDQSQGLEAGVCMQGARRPVGELARERRVRDKVREAIGPAHFYFSKQIFHRTYLDSTIGHYSSELQLNLASPEHLYFIWQPYSEAIERPLTLTLSW